MSPKRRRIRWHAFETDDGRMFLAATGRGVVFIRWGREGDDEEFVAELRKRFPDREPVRDRRGLAQAERRLRAYLRGERAQPDLPVDLQALTPFQRRVLETTRDIRPGEVATYGQVARRIGRPRAARAVGNALARNPVAPVVPCHRVVRSDGSLGGYTGGVERKRKLLALEGEASAAPREGVTSADLLEHVPQGPGQKPQVTDEG